MLSCRTASGGMNGPKTSARPTTRRHSCSPRRNTSPYKPRARSHSHYAPLAAGGCDAAASAGAAAIAAAAAPAGAAAAAACAATLSGTPGAAAAAGAATAGRLAGRQLSSTPTGTWSDGCALLGRPLANAATTSRRAMGWYTYDQRARCFQQNSYWTEMRGVLAGTVSQQSCDTTQLRVC